MTLTNPNHSSSLQSRLLFWSAIIFCVTVYAQSSEDIADEPAAIEKLSRKIVPTKTVATFLKLNFLQNLVVDSNGDIIVNSASDGRVWRVSGNGSVELLGQFPGQAFSVVESPENGVIVVGIKLDGVIAAFHISQSGELEKLVDIEGALFPNGLESLDGGRYLFADSVLGVIWELNYWNRSFEIFLKHELLTRSPNNWKPGANGLRIFNDKLFISNTNRKLFLSVQLCDNKPIVNTLKIVRKKIFIDDFDFDVDGNAYITTHPMNVVLRLTPKGSISVLAGPEQDVIGSTACRFGRRTGDEKSLYVAIDGGFLSPPSTRDRIPSGVVRLEIDTKGAPGGPKTVSHCAEKKDHHEEH